MATFNKGAMETVKTVFHVETGQAKMALKNLENTTIQAHKGMFMLTQDFKQNNGMLIRNKELLNKHGKVMNRWTTTQQAASKGFLGTGDKLSKILTKVASWTIATGAIFGTISAMKKGVGTMIEFESQMVSLQKVFIGTSDELRMLKKDILDTSVEMGSLTSKTAKAAIELGRMGKNRAEISELLKVSLLAQNIAELDASEATKLLNAAVLQFNKTADDAISILDQWNELSNRTPVETRALAEGMSIAGAVFNQAGGEIEDLNAYISTLSATMAKSGREIGTALKTITTYSRRQSTIKKLRDIAGINIVGENDSLMEVDEMLERVAAKWEHLTDLEREELSQGMAGVRQKAYFLNLMENFNMTLENQAIQWGAAGSAMEENEIRLSSLKTKIEQLGASFEKLAINEGDNLLIVKTLKVIVDGLRDLVTNLTEAETALKVFGTILAGGTTYLALKKLPIALASATKGVWALNIATKALTGTVMKWVTGVGIAIVVFNGFIALTTMAKRKQEAMRKEIEKSITVIKTQIKQQENLVDSYKSLSIYYDEYQKLKEGGKDTSEIEEKMKIVLEGINGIMPSLIDGTEDYATALDKVATAAKLASVAIGNLSATEIRKRRDLVRINLQAAKSELNKTLGTPATKFDRWLGTPVTSTYLRDLYKTRADAQADFSRKSEQANYVMDDDLELLQELIDKWGTVNDLTAQEVKMTEWLVENIRNLGKLKSGDENKDLIIKEKLTKEQIKQLALLKKEREYDLAKREGDKQLLALLRERLAVEKDVVEQLRLQYEITDLSIKIDTDFTTNWYKERAHFESLYAHKDAKPVTTPFMRMSYTDYLEEEEKKKKKSLKLTEWQRAYRRMGQDFADFMSDMMVDALTDGFGALSDNKPWNTLITSFGRDIGTAVSRSVTSSMLESGKGEFASAMGGSIKGALVAGGISMLAQILFPVEDKDDALTENTQSIRELTDEMREFNERYINAPSTFALGSVAGEVPQAAGGARLLTPGYVYGHTGEIIAQPEQFQYPTTNNISNIGDINVYAQPGQNPHQIADIVVKKIMGSYGRGGQYGSKI